MNYPVLASAIWAGLATPVSLWAAHPVYRPHISTLTFADSFSAVGYFVNTAARDIYDGQAGHSSHQSNSEQLSFVFGAEKR